MFETAQTNSQPSTDNSNSESETGFLNRQRFAPINTDSQTNSTAMPGSDIGHRIVAGNMFAAPQADTTQSGDFVNRNLLRLDSSGNPYRAILPSSSAGQNSGKQSFPQDSGGQSGGKQSWPQDSGLRQPIQTRDPQGRTQPKYRMGIGHRILGTLANFANGFAGNHVAPIYVGPGALNNRYYQDEAERQQQNQEMLQQRQNKPFASATQDSPELQPIESVSDGTELSQTTTGSSDQQNPQEFMDKAEAMSWLKAAHGNKDLARRMARRAGRKF